MRSAVLGVVGCVALAGCSGSSSSHGSGGPPDSGGFSGSAGTSAAGGSAGSSTGAGGSAGNPSAGGSAGGAGGSAAGGSSGGSGGQQGIAGCSGPFEELLGELCVAKVVAIDGGYAIDTTEVTRLQYADWLGTEPALPDAADPECGWNASYEPDPDCMDGSAESTVADPEHHPVVCVDWCDAFAYCEGIGKRLCGRLAGGTAAVSDFTDPNASQWYRACSSGGLNDYPYGDTRDAAACNGFDNPAIGAPRTTTVVGSQPGCQSSVEGFSGVYDLSGNVSEWEDSCSGSGEPAYCRLRGGGVVGEVSCGANTTGGSRNYALDYAGFRCCRG